MKATLHADGLLTLESATESRTVKPSHPSYEALTALYRAHGGISVSAAPSPFVKEDDVYTLPEGYGGHPWKDGVPDYDEVYNIPLEHINVDASRFQFKKNSHEDTGVTTDLDDDAFDPDKCGDLGVWQDPYDGKTYVVDGHHRRELGERAGVELMRAKYIKAESAEEARKIGGAMNGVKLSASTGQATLDAPHTAQPASPFAVSAAVQAEALRALRARFPLSQYTDGV